MDTRTRRERIIEQSFRQLMFTGGKDSRQEMINLINLGFNINGKNMKKPPIWFVINHGRNKCLDGMISCGVDCNSPYPDTAGPWSGDTPLQHCIESGNPRMAIKLIQAGADPNDGDYKPIYMACDKGHSRVVIALLNNGAKKDHAGEILAMSKWKAITTNRYFTWKAIHA